MKKKKKENGSSAMTVVQPLSLVRAHGHSHSCSTDIFFIRKRFKENIGEV